jgi:hypothetical protein
MEYDQIKYIIKYTLWNTNNMYFIEISEDKRPSVTLRTVIYKLRRLEEIDKFLESWDLKCLE